jgi:Mrp family chromosome partitioning ATPase
MKNLIKTLRDRYDYIVFDTPPLTSMADTRILSKMVDGLLLVVRPGVADYGSIMAAKKFLTNSDRNVLGIVANGVELKNEPYEYNYSYYSENSYTN